MVGVDNNAFYNSEPMTNGGGRGVAPVKLEMTEVENRGDPKNICVLGSGDFGRAFSARAVASGFRVQIGTRSLQKAGNLSRLIEATGATLSLQQKAVNSADVVIIAVGRDFFSTLPLENLRGKILVDVSNATPSQIKKSLLSNAEYLQQLIPSAQVVKAFNVVSAYLLETGGIQGSKEVPVASDCQPAQVRVNQIVRDMGFSPVDMGPLRAAREIEKMPLEFFRDWYGAFIVVGVIFVVGYIINIVKFQLCANLTENETWDWSPYKQILMTNFNRNLGVVALIVLGATYLPGVIAGFVQLFRGTKYKRFPRWLDRWLRMRKQLGLIMLAMAATHGCISLGIYGPDHQYDWLFEGPKTVRAQVKFNETAFSAEDMAVWKHEPSWRGELFLTCGAVSLCLLVMLGISSLPSVTALLTWREFSFVQSKLGWAALVAASIHDGVLGGDFMLFSYKCYMPTGLQMALYLPVLCVLGKLLLLLPPINRRLEKIRAGWTGKPTSNV